MKPEKVYKYEEDPENLTKEFIEELIQKPHEVYKRYSIVRDD